MRQDAVAIEMSADETDAEDSAEEVQVLELQLGPEMYCVDIEYVSEIVDKGQPTVVPSVPDYVEGMMDPRRRTTPTINPKSPLSIDAGDESKCIVTFDLNKFEDGAATGWLVDKVYQVVRVSMDDVEGPPLEKDGSIKGVIKRNSSLVIWTSPVHAIE